MERWLAALRRDHKSSTTKANYRMYNNIFMEWARSQGVRAATKECMSEFIEFYGGSDSAGAPKRSDGTIK